MTGVLIKKGKCGLRDRHTKTPHEDEGKN
jgi:hypothetical protein